MNSQSSPPAEPGNDIARRGLLKGGAWTVPAVALTVAAPAIAASAGEVTYMVDDTTHEIVVTNTTATEYTQPFYAYYRPYTYPYFSAPYVIAGGTGSAAPRAGLIVLEHALGTHTVPAGGSIRFTLEARTGGSGDVQFSLAAGAFTTYDHIILTAGGVYGSAEVVTHGGPYVSTVYGALSFVDNLGAPHEASQLPG